MSESRTLARERSGRKHGEDRVNSTLMEDRFQGGEGGQANRTFLEKVEA